MTSRNLSATDIGMFPADESAQASLDIDPETFRSRFNRRPFLIRHSLAGHPLFSLGRLIELARRLPPEFVEYNAGNIPISIESHLTPRNGLSAEQTIRRIEDHCSWMVLKRVEHDPAYAAILDRCLDQIEALARSLDPGFRMHSRAGAVFISSPQSVTPYHLDHEYNFLAQIRGHKFMSVFDHADRSVLSERELEDYYSGPALARNLPFKDEYQAKATVFELTSDVALHVPSTSPHWVRNGSQVSISFSIGFQSNYSDRMGSLFNFNARLRRRGWQPTPAGQSPWRDTAKYALYRLDRRLRRLVGKDDASQF